MQAISAYPEQLKTLVSRSVTLPANSQTGYDAWDFYLGSLGFTGTLHDKEVAWLQNNIDSPVTGTKRDLWTQFLAQRGFSGDDDGLRAYLAGGGSGSSSLSYVGTAQAYWKATEKSGEYLPDLTGNGHDARFGSVGAARVINKGRAKYLRLPGVAGNYASTPDSAALSVTGDIDIRVRVAADDWTPAAAQILISKTLSGSTHTFFIYINTTGAITAVWSSDGTAVFTTTSSVVVGAADGTVKWIRVTRVSSTGVVTFFTSDDGVAWTQLGAPQASTSGALFDSTSPVEVGTYVNGTSAPLAGRVYRAQMFNGIDGTKVFDADFTTHAGGTTSFVCSTGQTVTINSTSGADTNDPAYLEYTGTKYAYLPGAGNYISTPDHDDLDITGDIDIRVKVALDDWTPASEQTFVGKWVFGSYLLRVVATGHLQFTFRNSADVGTNITSTVVTAIPDGAVKWVRFTLDVDNGAAGHTGNFYTSDDGVTWTQLGASVVVAGATSIKVTTDPMNVGSFNNGSSLVVGKIFAAQVRNGIDGTVVADFNASTATEPYATTTDSTGKVWTFNRAATGKKLAVVDRTLALFGTDDYLEVQNQDNLNFVDAQPFTVVVVARAYSQTAGTNQAFLSKKSTFDTVAGWAVARTTGGAGDGTTGKAFSFIADGTASSTINAVADATFTLGTVRAVALVGYGDDSWRIIDNGTQGGLVSAARGSLTNTLSVYIGRNAGTAVYAEMELVGAAIFRKALTPAQLNQVKTELGG